MKLTILGCYAATPRTISNPTSQVLQIKNHTFLIDCGEGTQVQLRKHKVNFSRIGHIFISHLHGDHVYGLIGLISTFMLLNRQSDLHVYGPKGIKEMILLQLKLSKSFTGYNLYFHELSSNDQEVIFEDEQVVVKTIPLVHRVYTNGFLFQEKNIDRQLNLDALKNYGIEPVYFNKVKKGHEIVLEDGTVISNDKLTFDPLPAYSYAFCSDTKYDESITTYIEDVSVLYHESTFLHKDVFYAERTFHSTALEAATIAKLANTKLLLLGHFSTRYGSLDPFKSEAKAVFESTMVCDDGKFFDLKQILKSIENE